MLALLWLLTAYPIWVYLQLDFLGDKYERKRKTESQIKKNTIPFYFKVLGNIPAFAGDEVNHKRRITFNPNKTL